MVSYEDHKDSANHQSHPRSQEFLVRDVTRLVEWANKSGIEVELAEAMFDVLEMDLSHVQIHEEE